MCCLEGIIPHGEQLEQEPYFYQGIKAALVTLAGNQCRSVALTGDSCLWTNNFGHYVDRVNSHLSLV